MYINITYDVVTLEMNSLINSSTVNVHILNDAQRDAELSATVLAARGVISLQMGHLEGALLDLSRSIQVDPSAEALTNRGVVHCFVGDVPSAMRDYKRALTLDPAYHHAHYNIGTLLFSQRHFREACRWEGVLTQCMHWTIIS